MQDTGIGIDAEKSFPRSSKILPGEASQGPQVIGTGLGCPWSKGWWRRIGAQWKWRAKWAGAPFFRVLLPLMAGGRVLNAGE